MALFGRRRPPVPPGYAGLDPRDAAVVAELSRAGADLGRPREVRHYLRVPTEEAALAAAVRVRDDGYDVALSGPGDSGTWTVRGEHAGAVVSADYLRVRRHAFEALAAEHGGEYDGWEAAV